MNGDVDSIAETWSDLRRDEKNKAKKIARHLLVHLRSGAKPANILKRDIVFEAERRIRPYLTRPTKLKRWPDEGSHSYTNDCARICGEIARDIAAEEGTEITVEHFRRAWDATKALRSPVIARANRIFKKYHTYGLGCG